jgi:hypothetical protein
MPSAGRARSALCPEPVACSQGKLACLVPLDGGSIRVVQASLDELARAHTGMGTGGRMEVYLAVPRARAFRARSASWPA